MQYLRTIFYISLGLFLLPTLAILLGEGSPEFQAIVSFFKMYDQVIMPISAVVGGVSGMLLVILKWKERQALSIIRQARVRDDFWSEQQVKISTRAIFYTLHDCYLKGDYSDVKPFVTAKFYEELLAYSPDSTGLDSEILNPVDIVDTKIIAAKDKIQSEQDEVSVYFNGFFVFSSDPVKAGVSTFAVTKKAFQMICTFKREGQEWKLDEVDDTVTLFEIIVNIRSSSL